MEEWKVELHALSTSALDGDQLHAPAALTPEKMSPVGLNNGNALSREKG
jgi:hypothetical protein